MQTGSEIIRIDYDKKRLKKFWSLCLILFPFLIWALLTQNIHSGAELFIISFIATPIIFFLIIFIPFRIKSEAPAIIIDSLGILDYTGRKKGRFFPWGTILKAEVFRFRQSETLLIYVTNPREIIDEERSWRKYKMKINSKISGTPVEIACFNLLYDPYKLVEYINKKAERFKFPTDK